MATLKPRITITLTEHRHELLRRLAALRGVSMSAVVVELIETVSESLERVCVLMAAAESAPGQMQSGLKRTIQQQERRISRLMQEANAQGDMLLAMVEADFEGRSGEGASAPQRSVARPGAIAPGSDRRRVKASDPRPVITGVRSPADKGKHSAVVRVSGDSKKKPRVHAVSIKRGS